MLLIRLRAISSVEIVGVAPTDPLDPFQSKLNHAMSDLLQSLMGSSNAIDGGFSKKRIEHARTWQEFMGISLMQCLQVR